MTCLTPIYLTKLISFIIYTYVKNTKEKKSKYNTDCTENRLIICDDNHQ